MSTPGKTWENMEGDIHESISPIFHMGNSWELSSNGDFKWVNPANFGSKQVVSSDCKTTLG
jgi:hypothetical protein